MAATAAVPVPASVPFAQAHSNAACATGDQPRLGDVAAEQTRRPCSSRKRIASTLNTAATSLQIAVAVSSHVGARACTLPAIRREKLDEVVLEALLGRVLDPEHLQQLLAGLLERTEEADGRRRRALAVARTTRTEAEKAIGNLLTLIGKGTSPADSREVVERIALQRARQQVAATEVEASNASSLSRASGLSPPSSPTLDGCCAPS